MKHPQYPLVRVALIAGMLILAVSFAGAWAQEGSVPAPDGAAHGGWVKAVFISLAVLAFILLFIWNPGFAIWLLFSIFSGGRGGGGGGGGGFGGSGGGRSGGGGASGSW